MLLAFRARNSRSFRDWVEFSLLATRLSNSAVVREIPWREAGRPVSVLPVAGVFGANASGKSNLLRSMTDMRDFVLRSFRGSLPQQRLRARSFLLSEEERTQTEYGVDLVIDGVRHEYGFRLEGATVVEEWAHSYPRGKARQLFHRLQDDLEHGSEQRAKGRATQEILRPDALFLSTAAATNHPLLLPLFEWFERNLVFADVNTRLSRQALTVEMLDSARGEQVLELLREADLGITGVTRRDLDTELHEFLERVASAIQSAGELDEEPQVTFEDFEVRLEHKSPGKSAIELHPDDESRGTMVWFGLIGVIFQALEEGSVLLADELDASLHPALVCTLIALFQSKKSNPRRAQLIFNAHDVSMLADSTELSLGRDQVWFTEKDEEGGTHLRPLSDHDPRKGEAIGRRYLAGRYGATPIISIPRIEEIAAPDDDGAEE